jgi:hypothetical protein
VALGPRYYCYYYHYPLVVAFVEALLVAGVVRPAPVLMGVAAGVVRPAVVLVPVLARAAASALEAAVLALGVEALGVVLSG